MLPNMKQDKNGLGRATQSLRLARLAETARWVRCTGAFGAGLLLALTASAAQPPARGGTGAAKAVGCLIEPDRVADVGSQVIGVVDQIYVDRGDMVKAGQRLLALRADIERANASVAEKRSRVDADVLAAKAGLALAEQKVHRAEMLVTQKFVSDQAVDQARGEAEVARQKVNQVSSQQQIWVQERNVAEAQLEIRTVRSPFAGVSSSVTSTRANGSRTVP